jgi:major membrane immunogen (membrane-anchored lipoprotein)
MLTYEKEKKMKKPFLMFPLLALAACASDGGMIMWSELKVKPSDIPGGRYITTYNGEPFTGEVLDLRDDVKIISEFKDGKDISRTEYYKKSGKLKSEDVWSDDSSYSYRKYFENGQLKEENSRTGDTRKMAKYYQDGSVYSEGGYKYAPAEGKDGKEKSEALPETFYGPDGAKILTLVPEKDSRCNESRGQYVYLDSSGNRANGKFAIPDQEGNSRPSIEYSIKDGRLDGTTVDRNYEEEDIYEFKDCNLVYRKQGTNTEEFYFPGKGSLRIWHHPGNGKYDQYQVNCIYEPNENDRKLAADEENRLHLSWMNRIELRDILATRFMEEFEKDKAKFLCPDVGYLRK